MKLKSVAVAMILVLASGAANALTIGTLDYTRTNSDLATGSSYSAIRGVLDADGHTLTATGAINSSFLGGVDVFLTSVFNPFSALTGAPLAAEVTALTDWVTAGGTLIFSGEWGNFTSAFNSYTTAFGITMGGQLSNNNTGVQFVNNPSDPYLANGVAGTGWTVNNRGWIDSVTGSFTTLATAGLNPNELFAISKSFGQGTVVAFADTYFMNNTADPGNTARQFLLNAIDQHGANVSPVPEPESYAMLFAGLCLLGFAAKRRKLKKTAA